MPAASTVAELAVVVTADVSAAEKGLTDLGTKVGSAGSALQTAFGAAAVGGVVALGAGLASAVSSAADFEKTMSGVKAVSGATSEEMQQMSGLALQLGKDTSFSASEAAAGIEELVKGGLTIPDIMNGAAKATLDLAAAGGVSLPDAATIAANALAQFNLKGQDMAHVADLIAGAANASALDVGQFKFSLQAAGAVASTVGFSFDDLAQAIAVMGKAGITGSDAGTSLKTMMLALTPSTKAATKEMQRLGIITADGSNQFFDATGKVKSMAEVAGILQTATAGLTEQQKLQALQTIFGTDAIRAAAVMAKEGAAGFEDMAGAMGKVTAASVGAERLNNLAGSMEQFKGTLETLAITLGMQLLPVLKDMIDALNETAQQALPAAEEAGKAFAGMLSALIPLLKTTVGFLWDNRDAVAALVVALGTFVIITTVVGWVTTLIGAIGAITAAISAGGGVMGALGALVAFLGGPVTLIIAAVALAVGALAYAWIEDWGGIQEKTAAVVDFLSGVPDLVAGYWEAVTTATADLGQAISDTWTSIQQATEDIWNGIASFLQDWWRVIVVMLTGPVGALAVLIIDNWQQISDATETIWRAISNLLTAVWDLIRTSIIQPALDAIQTAVETAWEAVRSAIETKITAARDVLQTAWDAITQAATTALNALLTFIRDTIFEPIRAAVQEKIEAARDAVNAVWTSISDAAHTVFDPFVRWWTDTIWTPIQSAVETTSTAIETAFTDAVNGIKSTVDGTMQQVKSAWDAIWQAIETAAKSPADALKVVTDAVVKLKEVMPDWLIPHSPTPFEMGIRGISNAVKEMSKVWENVRTPNVASIHTATGEIADYIRKAAEARGIDPSAAIAIAQHEGGTDEPAKRGTFKTGSSWWPFQLHYGGKGYEYLGDTAGMGNDFTAQTGWAPGDPRAWKDSVDYALDYARKHGWSAWYGRGPAGIGAWEGIPGHAAGGVAGLHGPELGWLGEREPEAIIPKSWFAQGGSGGQTMVVPVIIGGQTIEELYITGRDLAVRRGRTTAGFGTPSSTATFAGAPA